MTVPERGIAQPPEESAAAAATGRDAGGAAHTAAETAAALRRVEAALKSDPQSFGFFQAVRLLERLQPERTRVGAFDEPAREVVRFGVNPALAFPPSEIHGLSFEGEQPVMKVNFMGLTGPQGVLPHQYSTLVEERLRARDGALADFLDLFHHRILSLFYEAWRSYRFTIAREDGDVDRLAGHLSDLIGLGLESTRNSFPFPDEALIHRAGLLAGGPRGAVALEQLIEHFFGLQAEVEQFVGGWYPLEQHDRCVISDDDDSSNVLGGGAVAGDEVWDQQARVRVRLGPLNRERYDSFLPGGSAHTELLALLRLFSHDRFDFQVQLVLRREQVTGLRLDGDGGTGQQLGWSTWICSAQRDRDAEETILFLQAGAAS
jgi:type VI secretion system protein ImpH